MSTRTDSPRSAGSTTDRDAVRQRIQARRDLGSHFVAYLVINAALVAVWAITGSGYFWPAWVLAFWGAGLTLHTWDVFFRRPVTDVDIDTELRRH